jgi:hypothetical protein
MLQACRTHGQRQGLTPVLYEQRLEHLELPRQYGLVMIPSGSFCLITDRQQAQESLRRIYAHMLPRARLVLEIERRRPQPGSTAVWRGRQVARPDGAQIFLSWQSRYDAGAGVLQSLHHYELCQDGQVLATEREELGLRLYDPVEFHRVLEAAGFKEINTCKAYACRAPDEADASLVFVCIKP